MNKLGNRATAKSQTSRPPDSLDYGAIF